MNILFFLTPKAELEYLKDDQTVRQAIEKIRIKGFTAIPIISATDGSYVGTVSEGDFLWHIIDEDTWNIRELEKMKVVNIIDKTKYQPVKIDAKVDDLLKLIMNQNFVPVVDDRLVFMGIITRRRVLQYYYDQDKMLEAIQGA